jgi:tyrosyl-DNA phosphodiesterase 2
MASKIKEGVSDSEVAIVGESYIFSLLTWNIDGLDNKDILERTTAVVKDIKTLKPDIIFIQEIVPMTWDILEKALDSDYHCRCANNELPYFHGLFVLKKKSIDIDDSLKITKFPNSQMLRHLLRQKVYIAGHPLYLFTSHLESMKSSAGERKNQLAQCFEQMTKLQEPSILGGDLNVRDTEVRSVGIPCNCVDAWESCGSDPEHEYTWDTVANNNLDVTWNSKLRFDRVYLCQGNPSNVKTISFRLVGKDRLESCGRFASDHWGIMAEFEIGRL